MQVVLCQGESGRGYKPGLEEPSRLHWDTSPKVAGRIQAGEEKDRKWVNAQGNGKRGNRKENRF